MADWRARSRLGARAAMASSTEMGLSLSGNIRSSARYDSGYAVLASGGQYGSAVNGGASYVRRGEGGAVPNGQGGYVQLRVLVSRARRWATCPIASRAGSPTTTNVYGAGVTCVC